MHKRTFPDHTADIALRVEASTINELFTGFALGFRDAVIEGPPPVFEKPTTLQFSENTREELLVKFLDELNYMFTAKKLVVTTAQQCYVSHDGETASVRAVVGFEPFDPGRQEALNEIKTVTFHQLKVAWTGEYWTATVVFDI